jgi:cytidylate kinase
VRGKDISRLLRRPRAAALEDRPPGAAIVQSVIVAIDGPVGAGKSTVARGVAGALGFAYLDSGALYRCVALATIRDPSRDAAEHSAALDVSLGDAVLLGGRDVTSEIRSPAVSALASVVAADPAVRTTLVDRQRELIASGDWVAEGRDIGTVVAPEAELKVFLTASAEERARRRAAELGADPGMVLAEQTMRDERDATREHSPLAAAPGAVMLDTNGLTVEQVVERIATLAQTVSTSV